MTARESNQIPLLSVVIPCFDEERRVAEGVRHVLAHLATLPFSTEVIVVDDGSRDATAEIVERELVPRVRLVKYAPNRGKGFAVREGLRAARGTHVLFTDADLATPIEETARFVARGEAGADLVVASRVLDDSRISVPQPLRRRLAGAAFRGTVRLLGLTKVRDTQCGFKLMRRTSVGPVLEQVATHRFAFDVELLARAERAGLAIVELPVDWRDQEGSRLRLWPDAVRMVADLIEMRRRVG